MHFQQFIYSFFSITVFWWIIPRLSCTSQVPAGKLPRLLSSVALMKWKSLHCIHLPLPHFMADMHQSVHGGDWFQPLLPCQPLPIYNQWPFRGKTHYWVAHDQLVNAKGYSWIKFIRFIKCIQTWNKLDEIWLTLNKGGSGSLPEPWPIPNARLVEYFL